MAQRDKGEATKTNYCIVPTPRPFPCPPEIAPHLRLKWGLALLGEEKARQYLDWLRTRLEESSR